jgi:tetraacyldisaccharide 4'-kinase
MKTPAFWQDFTAKTLALLPLSWLYRMGVWCDRETSPRRIAPIPVVSIGNATVGGAGKTPTTLALVPLLSELGFTPHILTRGYKSETPLTAHRVTDADTATTVGDEALLLARIATTWVGRDRLTSARAAHKNGASLAICDDAHQHYRLVKNLSLLVIDGPYGFGNGYLLPAGPLREPLHHALARADAIVLIGDDTHGITERCALPVFRAQLLPTTPLPQGERVVAFAGIGRPEKFFTTLREMGAELLATRAFPDHHTYTEDDIASLTAEAAALGAPLITTEKDAVKLPAATRASIRVLPVSLAFDDRDALREFLRQHLS